MGRGGVLEPFREPNFGSRMRHLFLRFDMKIDDWKRKTWSKDLKNQRTVDVSDVSYYVTMYHISLLFASDYFIYIGFRSFDEGRRVGTTGTTLEAGGVRNKFSGETDWNCSEMNAWQIGEVLWLPCSLQVCWHADNGRWKRWDNLIRLVHRVLKFVW